MDMEDANRILEVGTGEFWNTFLCDLLGSVNLQKIDMVASTKNAICAYIHLVILLYENGRQGLNTIATNW